MADSKSQNKPAKPDEQADVQPDPAPVTLESITAARAPAAPAPERARTRTEQESLDISRIAQEAEALHMDETVPGGRYLVDGILVDANGIPLKGKG